MTGDTLASGIPLSLTDTEHARPGRGLFKLRRFRYPDGSLNSYWGVWVRGEHFARYLSPKWTDALNYVLESLVMVGRSPSPQAGNAPEANS